MRTKKIYSSCEFHEGYGAGSGDTERYEYECPCGKGKLLKNMITFQVFVNMMFICIVMNALKNIY